MTELEHLLYNHQHIANMRVSGCSSSVTLCSHFYFGIELVSLLPEVSSQLGSLCFQSWCEESVLNREHLHVQGNVSHLTHRLDKKKKYTVILVQGLVVLSTN